MAHTTLLQRLLTAAAMAEEPETFPPSILQSLSETQPQQKLSRRAFLGQSGMALGGGLASFLPRPLAAATAPRIAIIGGGLAGLACAYQLRKAGLRATIYEAADRFGGRCLTLRDHFADGQMVEQGGELIDDGHTAIIQLVRELGLRLDNLKLAVPRGTQPCFSFDGVPYTFAEASRDIKAVAPKMFRDLRQAGYPTLHNRFTRRGRELDEMSIADWITASVPGGGQSRLGRLLDVAYNIEYGAETREQSALNLLYLMGGVPQSPLRLFGKSNEKYHIRGGNDLLVTRLVALLREQIELGHALTAIQRKASGGYELTLQMGGGTRTVQADHVVLALPFTVLREAVDYRQAGFSTLKQTAIRELAMGTNAKMHVQFSCRHWHTLGFDGESYADT
ncbi:MAG: FAD-dependent oxidoreductase, partial [Blastocatellia bacterium]